MKRSFPLLCGELTVRKKSRRTVWSRLDRRVAWIMVKALEKWEEMKRERLI